MHIPGEAVGVSSVMGSTSLHLDFNTYERCFQQNMRDDAHGRRLGLVVKTVACCQLGENFSPPAWVLSCWLL